MEVDGIGLCPVDGLKPGDERRFVRVAAIGRDKYGEVAAHRVLVPEGQLHGCVCGQVEGDALQVVGLTIRWIYRIETHAFRVIMAGAIADAVAPFFGGVAPFVAGIIYRSLAVVPASRDAVGYGEIVEVLGPWEDADGIARCGEVADFRRSAGLGFHVGRQIKFIVGLGVQTRQGVSRIAGNAY